MTLTMRVSEEGPLRDSSHDPPSPIASATSINEEGEAYPLCVAAVRTG